MNYTDSDVAMHGISPSEAAKYHTLFKLLDADNTGAISRDELAELMPRMGAFLSEDELSELFNSVDTDGSGEIDFYEFLQLMARHREANQLALLEGGRACFLELQAASTFKHVIRADHPVNWLFDLVTLMTILYYIIVVTFDDVIVPDIFFFRETKLIGSCLMVVDIFRSSIVTFTPDLADTLPMDSVEVVRARYFRSWKFLFDVLSALPIDLVVMFLGWGKAMRVVQHLRLAKLFSWPSLFRVSPTDIMSPKYASFNFFYVPVCKIVFWTVAGFHNLSLLWIVISRPSRDVRYIDAMFFSTYTLTTTGFGGAEANVETQNQKYYCIFLFCCAAVVNGLIVGKLVQFSQQGDLQTDRNRRMLETLAALNHLTIPQDFKEEVLAFQLHRLKHSNSLFNEAISGLPQVMQDRMALYARMKIVRQVPIFAEAQEICVAKLAQSLVNVFVPPEEYIVIAGEEGEEMFFLFHGMCGVTLPDGKWAATIKRGGVFGEVALLQETRRSASIKSLTYCQLFRLDKGAFASIIDVFPALLDSIEAVSVALQMRIRKPVEESAPAVKEDTVEEVTMDRKESGPGWMTTREESVYFERKPLARQYLNNSTNVIDDEKIKRGSTEPVRDVSEMHIGSPLTPVTPPLKSALGPSSAFANTDLVGSRNSSGFGGEGTDMAPLERPSSQQARPKSRVRFSDSTPPLESSVHRMYRQGSEEGAGAGARVGSGSFSRDLSEESAKRVGSPGGGGGLARIRMSLAPLKQTCFTASQITILQDKLDHILEALV